MYPTPDKNRRGATVGALLGIVVVLALVVFAGLWVQQSRQKMLTAIDSLQANLTTAQANIEDLEQQVHAGREARDQVEAKAKEAQVAAEQARQKAERKQADLQEQIETLQASAQKYQQQVAAANDAKSKIEAELARETEQHQAAKNQLATIQEQLKQQETLVSELQQQSAGTVTESQPMGSSKPAGTTVAAGSGARTGTSAAGKQRLTEEGPGASSAAFDTPPKPVNLVSPDYPEDQRRQRENGYVVVAFTVDTEGRVNDVEVQDSTNDAFEAAALSAVRQWRFKPARRDGQPVEVRLSQRLDFTSK